METQSNNLVCPICDSKATKEYWVDRKKVESGLEAIFGTKVPKHILKVDYTQFKCTVCTLSFSWPLVPGDSDFYNFIASQNGYYSDYRPEYEIMWNILRAKTEKTTVLDVGCGDGSFLEKTLSMPNIDELGIDSTLISVEKSVQKGINTYHTTIENLDKADFDIIVAFHCLEHVPNPFDFLQQMVNKIKDDGKIFISTPYSPFSYEYFWFHPLNHPPHHLLRLNKKAYETLASKLDLNVKFHNFEKMSFKSHVKSCFAYAKYGTPKKENLYLDMLMSPILSLKIILKMLKRDRINNVIAGNDILVEFSK